MRREKKDVTTETDTWVYYGRIPNYYGRQQQQAIYHPYLRVLGFIHNNRTQYGRQEAHVLLVQDTRENGRVQWTHTQKKAIFHRGPREAVQVPDATGGTFDTGRPEQLNRWDRNVVNTRPHGKRLSRTVIIFSCFSRRRPCTRSNACTTTGFGQSDRFPLAYFRTLLEYDTTQHGSRIFLARSCTVYTILDSFEYNTCYNTKKYFIYIFLILTKKVFGIFIRIFNEKNVGIFIFLNNVKHIPHKMFFQTYLMTTDISEVNVCKNV